MTVFYGSSAKPIDVFGADTKELACFYTVVQELLKGAWECRKDMIDLWQSWALSHSFTLPDHYHVTIDVIQKKLVNIEIDELDHHRFTHTIRVHEGMEKYISLPANIIHAIDGYMVREMGRRCNYDVIQLKEALNGIEYELVARGADTHNPSNKDLSEIVSLVEVGNKDFSHMDTEKLLRLRALIHRVLKNESFELVCIHDAFKCHANNVNTLRYWYKEILAEFAESDLLSQIFSEIEGEPVIYDKLSNSTVYAQLIRNSEYAVC